MKKYKILVTPHDDTKEPYDFEIKTKDIEWVMEQYQRNRDPFNWKIIE